MEYDAFPPKSPKTVSGCRFRLQGFSYKVSVARRQRRPVDVVPRGHARSTRFDGKCQFHVPRYDAESLTAMQNSVAPESECRARGYAVEFTVY